MESRRETHTSQENDSPQLPEEGRNYMRKYKLADAPTPTLPSADFSPGNDVGDAAARTTGNQVDEDVAVPSLPPLEETPEPMGSSTQGNNVVYIKPMSLSTSDVYAQDWGSVGISAGKNKATDACAAEMSSPGAWQSERSTSSPSKSLGDLYDKDWASISVEGTSVSPKTPILNDICISRTRSRGLEGQSESDLSATGFSTSAGPSNGRLLPATESTYAAGNVTTSSAGGHVVQQETMAIVVAPPTSQRNTGDENYNKLAMLKIETGDPEEFAIRDDELEHEDEDTTTGTGCSKRTLTTVIVDMTGKNDNCQQPGKGVPTANVENDGQTTGRANNDKVDWGKLWEEGEHGEWRWVKRVCNDTGWFTWLKTHKKTNWVDYNASSKIHTRDHEQDHSRRAGHTHRQRW